MTQKNDVLGQLHQIIQQRLSEDSSVSYVAKLSQKGEEAILKKIAEESAEVIMAVKDKDNTKIIYEVADLWFHCLVLLANCGTTPQAVLNELERRQGLSGIMEKNSRK